MPWHFTPWLLVHHALCSRAHLLHLLWHIPERAPGKKCYSLGRSVFADCVTSFLRHPNLQRQPFWNRSKNGGIGQLLGGQYRKPDGNEELINLQGQNKSMGDDSHVCLTSCMGLDKDSLERRKGLNGCYSSNYSTCIFIICCPLQSNFTNISFAPHIIIMLM